MKVYLCLDDRGGLLFNGRRLSRDGLVLADLASDAARALTIDPFSEKLLASSGIPYELAHEQISEDACFFLENRDPAQLLPKASELVIYRWNRVYPSDVRWEETPEAYGFSLKERTEFSGKSHEKITKEVYIK